MADISDLPVPPKNASVDISDLPAPQPAQERPRMPTSIRGAMRRMQEPGFVPPAAQPIPSREELASKWTQAGIGAGAAIPGTVGDIESIGRFVGRKVGAPISQQTFFPTSEQIAETFAGPVSPEDEESRKIGMLAGGLFGPSALAKGLRLAGESALIGRPSIRAAQIAKDAEKEGFKVSAAQARQAEPKGVPMSASEQQKMNRLVSKETGEVSDVVGPEFITKRRNELGKDYKRLYKQNFDIDSQVASAANNVSNFLQNINPAGSAKVKNIAENIVSRIDPATLKGTISGKELQALRTEVSNIAWSSSNSNARLEARQLVNAIDKAIENTNPAISKELKETNRKYWATMTLQDLRLSKDPSIMAGNVSPQKLGSLIESEGGLANHPLKKYGDYGTALKMRSITEGAQAETDPIKAAIALSGRAAKALTPIVSPVTDIARRAIQRKMTPGVVKTPVIMPVPAAAATAGKFVPQEVEE